MFCYQTIIRETLESLNQCFPWEGLPAHDSVIVMGAMDVWGRRAKKGTLAITQLNIWVSYHALVCNAQLKRRTSLVTTVTSIF